MIHHKNSIFIVLYIVDFVASNFYININVLLIFFLVFFSFFHFWCVSFWTFSNRLIVFFFSISLRLVDLMQQSNVYAMQSRSNSLFGNIFTATATAVLLMNCSKSKVREKTTSSWSGRRGHGFQIFICQWRWSGSRILTGLLGWLGFWIIRLN